LRIGALSIGLLLVMLSLSACGGGKDELILGATTSAQDTGLLDALVKAFESDYDYAVKPIVGGSGQILEQAKQGELDVIMTHSPADEEAFMAEGYGADRTTVMQNFFLLAGPGADPAKVAGAASMTDAFRNIAASEHPFISRGDQSGTHKRELVTWAAAGIEDPAGQSWYAESATGQGQSILVANERDAYTLADSSTFAVFKGRVKIVELMRDRDKPNVYSVIRLNPARLDKVNTEAADAWLEFLSGEGQEVIAEFGSEEYGEPLFEPLAR